MNFGAPRRLSIPHSGKGLLASRIVNRRELIELGVTLALVGLAAVCHFALGDVLDIRRHGGRARRARRGSSGTRRSSSAPGSAPAPRVSCSPALGNLPELFIALFALSEGPRQRSCRRRSSARSSRTASSSSGSRSSAGGLRNGPATLRLEPGAHHLDAARCSRRRRWPCRRSRTSFHTPAADALGGAVADLRRRAARRLRASRSPRFLRSTGEEEHVPRALVDAADDAFVLGARAACWPP